MHIRTFRAPSMQQALAEIRQQMGPDATVLHTRAARRSGWRWWPKGAEVEVTAGLRAVSIPPADVGAPVAHDRLPPASVEGTAGEAHWQQQFEQLSRQVERLLKQPPREVLERNERSPAMMELHREQIRRGWSAAAVDQTIAELRQTLSPAEQANSVQLRHGLAEYLRRRIRSAGPISVPPGQRRQIALVGPTGVGKTTTIAKLAAGFRLSERCRVGLITIDTFRIAAVEQLRAYADIMDLPMEVVERSEDLPGALARLASVDLVLIDTVGRSPRETPLVDHLRRTLDQIPLDELHLVVSATSSEPAMASTLKGFAALEPTHLLLTKLDEVDSLAPLLSGLCQGGLPIGYVTNGQRVPDDIQVVEDDRLITWLIDGLPTGRVVGAAA
jgi:flagellar biosynthesis protein FlhF